LLGLSPHNQFFIDNEAFRVLLARKQGVKFTEKELELYKESWDHSVDSITNMLAHIGSRKPHALAETNSFNQLRFIILMLTVPLANVTDTNGRSIAEMERLEKLIEDGNMRICSIENDIMVPQHTVEPVQLEKPRTVCTHPSCVETYSMEAGGGQAVQVYKQHCHAECYLPPVPLVLNNPKIQGCTAFGGGSLSDCRVCGHGWQQHMHILVDHSKKSITVRCPLKEAKIHMLGEDVNKAEEAREALRDMKKKLKEEQKVITKVGAKLGIDLKTNVIIIPIMMH